jgi:SAM-dependent methyltransferase
VRQAVNHYKSRFEIRQIDAQDLPFEDGSFDVILLLEAIYYLPEPDRFVAEARRVLRDGGVVFVCSANCERPDFNPSPYTHKYFTAAELRQLLRTSGFQVEMYGGYPVTRNGFRNRVLGAVRQIAIATRIVPKTMKWKIRVKRLLFGKLAPIPRELDLQERECEQLVPIDAARSVQEYKVIYAVGRRAA